MKSFFVYLKVSIRSKLYYRTSLILNMISPIVVLCGQLLLWRGLFDTDNTMNYVNMSRKAMLSYILVAFVLNNSLNWSTENSLSKDIRDGMVVSKIIRPTSFLSQNIAEMLGGVMVQGIFYAIFVLCIFFTHEKDLFIPRGINLIFFLMGSVLGTLLKLIINDVFSLLCFFVTGYLGIAWLKSAIINFFSGAIIPITLFPKTLRYVADYLPFKHMIQVPISIFLGEYEQSAVLKCFIIQILWIIFFVALHCVIYKKIRINMIIAGG